MGLGVAMAVVMLSACAEKWPSLLGTGQENDTGGQTGVPSIVGSYRLIRFGDQNYATVPSPPAEVMVTKPNGDVLVARLMGDTLHLADNLTFIAHSWFRDSANVPFVIFTTGQYRRENSVIEFTPNGGTTIVGEITWNGLWQVRWERWGAVVGQYSSLPR